MPIYEFKCASCRAFEAVFQMGSAPDVLGCPECGRPAKRRITAPKLSRTGTSAFRLIDQSKRSAHEPEVVTGLPASGSKKVQPYTGNPLHRNLPRP